MTDTLNSPRRCIASSVSHMLDFADRACEQNTHNAEAAEGAEKFFMLLKATTKARKHEENQRTFPFRVFVSSWLHFSVSSELKRRIPSRLDRLGRRPAAAEQNDENRRCGEVRRGAGVGGVARVAQPAIHLVDRAPP